MDQVPYWDEPLPPAMLTEFTDPLSEKQIDTLWSMFVGIDTHWRLGFPVNLLRSRWLDMIEARRAEDPDYTAEYANAARSRSSRWCRPCRVSARYPARKTPRPA